MAACPYHPTAGTTARAVPVEVYPLGGGQPYRLAGAQMHCCAQCGVQWYDENELARLPHVGLITTPALTQDNWDC